MATYGLDNPELTVTVQYTPDAEDDSEVTSETFTISISRDPEEREKQRTLRKKRIRKKVKKRLLHTHESEIPRSSIRSAPAVMNL